jgi:DNA-binding LytR/AlgR family response regulator
VQDLLFLDGQWIDMNVLVIEYEKLKAQKVKDLLYQIDDSIQVVGVTDDMLQTAEWLNNNKIPDLFLANTSIMAGVETGTDIKTLVTISTVTGDYSFAAFRYKTIRQILSNIPATEERLIQLDRFGNELERPLSAGPFKERFLVKQGQKLLSIPVGQIAFFFSQDRFIFLKTFDNQKFLVEYRIEQLDDLLSPSTFFRVNRSFIVSLATVKEIHSYFGNRLKLYLSPAADKDVLVSRKRVSDFKSWLGK